MALLTNGTVRLARGFTSSTYVRPSCTAYCTLISPRTSSASANARVCRLHPGDVIVAEQVGREHARGITGVNPRFLDVLHDAADQYGLAVAYRVHVRLEGVLEEAIQ